MKKIRIFQPGDLRVNDVIELTSWGHRHAAQVLRMRSGDELCLFSGVDNTEYSARIEKITGKATTVRILAVESGVSRESPRKIYLAQSIVKGERMPLVIQKAVELGVSGIIPVASERSVVRIRDDSHLDKKLSQWQDIALAACEQCGRNTVPTITPVISLQEFVQTSNYAMRFILWQHAQESFGTIDFTAAGDIVLLTGPEGGLTEVELSFARHEGFIPVAMGRRVLRTETASIAALAILQALAGDLT